VQQSGNKAKKNNYMNCFQGSINYSPDVNYES